MLATLFGKRVNLLRTLRRMTQAELAAKAGVSLQYLSRVERGISGPSFLVIEKLAMALMVEPSALFLFSAEQDHLGRPGKPKTEEKRTALLQEDPYSSRVGSWKLRLSASELYWSRALCELFGYAKPHQRRTVRFFLKHIHPADVPRFEAFFAARAQGAAASPLEFRFTRKDGLTRQGLVYADVVMERDGEADEVSGVVRDVTEWRLYEKTLRRRMAQLEEFVRIRARDLPKALEKLAAAQGETRIFETMTASSEVAMFFVSADRAFKAVNHAFETMSDCSASQLLGKDISTLTCPDDVLERIMMNVDSALGGEGRVVSEWFSCPDGGRKYLRVNYSPCKHGGAIIGAAAVFHDLTEVMRKTEALRLHAHAVDSCNASIAFANVSGVITYVNQDFLKTFRQNDAAESLGLRVTDLFETDDGKDILKAAEAPGGWGGLVLGKRADGTRFEARSLVCRISGDEGQPLGIMISAQDESASIEAERLLRESAKNYRELFEHSPLPMVEHDYSDVHALFETLRREGVEDFHRHFAENPSLVRHCASLVKTRDINKAGLAFFGVSLSAEIIPDLREYLTPDGFSTYAWACAELAGGKTVIEGDVSIYDYNRDVRRLSAKMSVLPTPERPMSRVLLSYLDRTEQFAAEQALAESADILRTIAEATPDIVMLIDNRGRIAHANEPARRLIGTNAGGPANGNFWESLSGEEHEDLREYVRECMLEGVVRRFQMKTGSTYREYDLTPVSRSPGSADLVVIHGKDVTVFKRAEQELIDTVRELEKRTERLRCLFEIFRLAEKDDVRVDAFLSQAVKLLPMAWLTSQSASARIDVQGKVYENGSFRETGNALRRDIVVNGHAAGYLEIRYLADRQAASPLLREDDRHFVESLSTILGRIIGRAQSLQALKESREGMQALFDGAGDVIFVCGAEGRILDVSSAAVFLLGYEKSEFLSGSLDRFVASEHRELCRSMLGLDEGVCLLTCELNFVCKNGRAIPFETQTRHVRYAGKPAAIAIARDVSQRRRVEASLKKAKDAAEKADRVKTEFLARMSHEIRTPINAMTGMLELVLQTNMDAEQRGYLQTAHDAARHLISIINDILDISRIEAGKTETVAVDFDLKRTLTMIMEAFRVQADLKGIGLQYVVDPATPEILRGDAPKLRQILFNLVGNAVKFTDKGGVEVHVAAWKDADGEERQENGVTLLFSVDDTGIGIPKEKRERLFERFSQLVGRPGGDRGGSGLGLAICRQLADIMGGRVWIADKPGRGTLFQCALAFAIGDPENLALSETRPEGESGPAKTAGRILIVDDSLFNRKAALAALRKMGHDPTDAPSGAEALRLVAGRSFDLVLMDLEMPDMDGLETVRRIRNGEAGEAGRTLPVLAMTAHSMDHCKKLCLENGMNGFLTKPVRFQELRAAIDAVFAEHDPSRDERAGEKTGVEEDLSVFVPEKALGFFGDDKEMYLQSLSIFFKNYPEAISDVKRSAQTGDLERARMKLHSIKSNCAMIGAEKSRNLASRLEHCALTQDVPGLWELLPRFETALCETHDGAIK